MMTHPHRVYPASEVANPVFVVSFHLSLEDFKGENQRLQHTGSQKTAKVRELEAK